MPSPWAPPQLMPGAGAPGTGAPGYNLTGPTPGFRPAPRGPNDPATGPGPQFTGPVPTPGISVGAGPAGGTPNVGNIRLPYQQRDGGIDLTRAATGAIGLMTGLPGGLIRYGAEYLAQRNNVLGRSELGQRIRGDMYERQMDDYTREQLRKDAAEARDGARPGAGSASGSGGGGGGPRPGAGNGTTIAEGKAAQTMFAGMRDSARAQQEAAQLAEARARADKVRK